MNFVAFLDFVNVFVAVAFGFYVYSKDTSSKLNRIFIVYCLLSGYSSFCEYFRLLASTEESAIMWAKVSFVWPFLPLSFLAFALTLIGNHFKYSKINIVILSIIALTIAGLHLFSDSLYAGVEKDWYGWNYIISKKPVTILLPIFVSYCTIISYYIMIRFYKTLNDTRKKKQVLFASLGFSIPYISGFITQGMLPGISVNIPPVTEISFIIGTIFLSFSLLKYKFLIPNPIETLNQLLSNIIDYLVVYNRQGKIVLASNSFTKCIGYGQQNINGENLLKFLSFTDHTIESRLLDTAGLQVQGSIISRETGLIPVDFINSVVFEKLGHEKLYLIIGRDLRERKRYEQELLTFHSKLEERVRERTNDLASLNIKLASEIIDHKKTEEALRISEKRFRDLFENSLIGIYRTTPEGKILLANPAIIKMLKFDSLEELAQRNLATEGFNDFSRTFFKEKIELYGEVNGVEAKWVRKDGSVVVVRESAKCVYDKEGAVTYYEGTVEDITEQVRIIEALKESEEQFRSLAEQSPNVIFMMRANKILYINDKCQDVLGYSKEYLTSIDFKLSDFVFGSLKVIEELYSDKFLNGNESITREITLVTSNSKLIETLFSIKPINYKGGRAFLGVIVDITERIEFERALKQSEETYRSIFENTSAVMLLVDPDDYNIMSANKAACRYYGYQANELSGMNIFSIDTSRNNIGGIRNWYDVDTSDDIYAIHKLASGEKRDVQINCGKIPIRGKIVLFLIIYDITLRRLAEKQLDDYKNHLENLIKERTKSLDDVNSLLKNEIEKLTMAEISIEEQYLFLQTLIDTIPNPIYMSDIYGQLTGCNKAYEKFIGRKTDEIIGKYLEDIYSPENVQQIKIKDKELLESQQSQKHEFKLKDAAGNEFDLLVYKALYLRNDGSVAGIVGILIDITEIKKMEIEVRKSLQKEKELSELKSRFISVTSHEFRTPLTSILSSADLLEMYGRKWPEVKYYEYIGHIQKAVEYMTELINDVLIVSRSDTGQLKFSPDNTNLLDLIKKILKDVQTSFSKDIKVELEYQPKEKIYYLDSKLITQIITNLVSNAIKYSNPGGKVYLMVKEDHNQLFIAVCDNGIGISEEDLKRLFLPFHRGSNVGTISGTGLGLSIALKSAELHKGNIFVNSKINEGTTFTLVLKLS